MSTKLILSYDSVADFFIVLYDAILAGKATHGREGTYFSESGQYAFKDVSAKIGEALVELGVSSTAEPTPFVEEDFKDFPYVCVRGRCAYFVLLIG